MYENYSKYNGIQHIKKLILKWPESKKVFEYIDVFHLYFDQ